MTLTQFLDDEDAKRSREKKRLAFENSLLREMLAFKRELKQTLRRLADLRVNAQEGTGQHRGA